MNHSGFNSSDNESADVDEERSVWCHIRDRMIRRRENEPSTSGDKNDSHQNDSHTSEETETSNVENFTRKKIDEQIPSILSHQNCSPKCHPNGLSFHERNSVTNMATHVSHYQNPQVDQGTTQTRTTLETGTNLNTGELRSDQSLNAEILTNANRVDPRIFTHQHCSECPSYGGLFVHNTGSGTTAPSHTAGIFNFDDPQVDLGTSRQSGDLNSAHQSLREANHPPMASRRQTLGWIPSPFPAFTHPQYPNPMTYETGRSSSGPTLTNIMDFQNFYRFSNQEMNRHSLDKTAEQMASLNYSLPFLYPITGVPNMQITNSNFYINSLQPSLNGFGFHGNHTVGNNNKNLNSATDNSNGLGTKNCHVNGKKSVRRSGKATKKGK